MRQTPVRVDRDERPVRERRPGGSGQLLKLETPHGAEPKRFRNRKRPVPEMRLGREQLDTDALLTQRAQREGGLEGGDSPARDQHVRGAAASGHTAQSPPDNLDRTQFGGAATRSSVFGSAYYLCGP